MPSTRTLPWAKVIFGIAVVALVLASVLARSGMRCPAAAGCPSQRAALPSAHPFVADPATGALLVDLEDDASLEDREAVARELASAIAPFAWGQGLGEMLSDDAELFRVRAPESEVSDVLARLGRNELVEGVEVERTWSLPETELGFIPSNQAPPAATDGERRFTPDDPYYRFQWHLDQIGMPEAWTRARGAGVVVAVIDTGVAYRDGDRFLRAPDLARTRFVEGWDFVDDDAQPDDEHGHGTHVAGTIAQSTHNALGVAGVAPEAAIMPLRVLDRNGAGGWGAIAASIRWAADHGANVINMSLGGGMRSRTVERAIEYAHEKGVVVVAAAGNASRSTVEYPARHDHVIAVGAVRFDRTLSFYSSYGRGLDVVAPGGDTRVDQNGDGMPDGVLQNTLVGRDPRRFDYVAYQGTSMAAPHVAGVAALIVGAGVTDPDAVERVLTSTATDLGDRTRYAAGLVQANAALARASQETGAARGALAALLGLGVLVGLRRRGKLGVGIAGATMLAVVLAGGLGALPWHLVPGLGGLESLLAGGGPGTAAHLGGRWTALLAMSALVPLAAVALMLHFRKMQPLLVGLCLGTAAFLLVEALAPTTAIALLPGWLAGPWLVLNAGVALWLGRQVARQSR
ncbi:S8 family peptidase [Sandaracinus amylolyticus]|uniref:S8 family peptidase n=1 Tax=Sandaracinus amylolyticus TaxID=927083 RepID=UPI001F3E2D60|nr:S8 family peptidase [Sandaracinus amylolyticus]UJR79235.1 Alkaline serine protease [Sandaracinus amylolyticus]